MVKKILLVLLLSVLLASMMACGASDAGTKSGPDAKENNAEPHENASPKSDGLPDRDFEGYDFTILTREGASFTREIIAESITGETINDAVFARNAEIEERFGVKISVVTRPERGDVTTAFMNSIKSGGHDYDVALNASQQAASIITQDGAYNWINIPYIGFDNPWWDKSAHENLKVNGKLFAFVGDITLSPIDYMYVMLYNKNIGKNYGIENLGELALAGKWTLDEMAKVMAQTTKDLNGDGQMDDNDLWGLAYLFNAGTMAFQIGCELYPIKKDRDGIPEINMASPKMVDAFEKVFDIIAGGKNAYELQLDHSDNKVINFFAGGRAFMLTSAVTNLFLFREMEDDFGILPYPKYDLTQENYYSYVAPYGNLIVLPSNLENPERTGIVLESMCAGAYKSVVPAYFEVTLPAKLTRDENSMEILALVKSMRSYDFSRIVPANSVEIVYMFQNLISAKNKSYMAYHEKHIDNSKIGFDKYLQHYFE